MSLEKVLTKWQSKFPFSSKEDMNNFTKEVVNALEPKQLYSFIIKIEVPKYFSPPGKNDTLEDVKKDRKDFFEFYKKQVNVVFESLKINVANNKYPWFYVRLNKEQINRLRDESFVEEIIAEYRVQALD
ncbi:hypothetical protein HZA97_07535 [Candidatus Woesearchaeota archaeon]|nr:hypothetical protein [Candidatus Woesearchaeota archaeon]